MGGKGLIVKRRPFGNTTILTKVAACKTLSSLTRNVNVSQYPIPEKNID